MDKFVVAIKKDNKQNDLLNMLLEANSQRQVGSKSSAPSQSFAPKAVKYDDLVLCSHQPDSKKVTGWKNSDGVKSYSTFRDGKVVTETGKAAFLLALGDSNRNKEKELKGQTSDSSGKSKRKSKRNIGEVLPTNTGVGNKKSCLN